MADAIVSIVLEQLTFFAVQEIKGGISLVAGAGQAVESLPSTLATVQAVLRDAEEKQVKDKAVKLWLDKLKDAAYDMEDVLDEWRTSILKLKAEEAAGNASTTENASIPKRVRSFFLSSGFTFKQLVFRRRISLEIKDINERLDVIAKERDRYSLTIRSTEQPQRDPTTSFVDVSEIYGRNEENATLVSKLLGQSTSRADRSLHIISIVGMGGMGKTTLAQLAYNNNEVINKFEKRMWVCVSDPFDEFKVAKEITEALTGEPSKLGALQLVLESISTKILAKKFLLVLDDVWTENYDKWRPLYNCLKNGHRESKILITTRKETVAQVMKSIDIITINELHEESCWSLFKSLAFSNKSPNECEELEGIGRKIIGKCKGLPLPVKIMGSLLRFKKSKEEWESVLHSEMWKLEKFEEDLFPTLFLSYNDLPSMVKRCFSYCNIFPKDYDINKDQLIQLWMAQGYLGLEQNKVMKLIGEEYFDILVARSLFQDLKRDYYNNNIIGCKIYDIVHDFTLFLTENEKGHHAMLVGEKVPSADFVSIYNVKKLRSLLVKCELDSFDITVLFSKFLVKLTHLRALGIETQLYSTSRVAEEIPEGIKKLTHLRYLNLSANWLLKELPEAICELYNLQTLDVNGCCKLNKLPQKMEKLINLRHLINNGTRKLEYMPKGVGKLTCLRTLQEFVVSDNTKACSLDCLRHLSNLHSLGIKGLGYLRDVGEAKRAQLKNNQNLLSLDLYFGYKTVFLVLTRINENDKVILEALQPPPNLKKLNIHEYGGSTLFPNNWMVSLTNLRVLSIVDCISIKHLPSLGKLSSLEVLKVMYITKVKSVGNEILGIKSDDTSAIAFPKLKSLTFRSMPQWKEWNYEITKKDEKDITIMPSLRSLHISDCARLKAIPNNLLQSATLEELRLCFCPIYNSVVKSKQVTIGPKSLTSVTSKHIPQAPSFLLKIRLVKASYADVEKRCRQKEATTGCIFQSIGTISYMLSIRLALAIKYQEDSKLSCQEDLLRKVTTIEICLATLCCEKKQGIIGPKSLTSLT